MGLRRFSIAVAFLLAWTGSAAAQGVNLRFQDGKVTLSAQNVPLRTILNEWARLGGTRIVNGDRVPGGLVTIELSGVPERQALDTLLRSASGYLAGPKPVGSGGASQFASILILPTSSAPRNAGGPGPVMPQPVFPAAPPQRFPGQPGFVGGRPVPQAAPPPDPDDDPAGDVAPPEDDADDAPRVRNGRLVGGPRQPTPPQPFQPGDDDQPAPQAPTTTPGNPFGSAPIGSARPGEITPVPQQRSPRSQPDPEP